MNRFFLKGAIVALIVSGALLSGQSESFLEGFDRRQLLALLAVQPLVLLGLMLQGVRHGMLIDRPGLSYVATTKAVALAQGLNLFLPARLSEVLKATYLRDRANVPISTGLSAVLLERMLDLIIVGLLGLTCLVFFAAMFSKTMVSTLFAVIVLIFGFAIWGGRGIMAVAKIMPWSRLSGFIERAYLHFSVTVKTPRFIHGLGIGLLCWALSFLNVLLLVRMAGSLDIGIYGALLVFIFTTLGGAVPVMPGGLGTYEAGAVFALTSLGYAFTDALVLAVTIHSAQLLLPLTLSLAVMLTERLGLFSLVAELRTIVKARLN